ncbi:MAG: ParA family protein [Clostridia bacterium]|nr:ParA family protein [Clostridia bacterium]
MSKTIAVVNQKGGVGKTTTAVNLCAALGAKGKKILLVDIDPQGNSTSGFGVNKRDLGDSAYEVLTGAAEIGNAILVTDYKNVSLVPSKIDLAGAEIEIIEMPKRERLLRAALAGVTEDYDYIFLDCPPSLGLITLNALTAADTFLVPVQPEYYALEGLSQLMATVRRVKRMYNQYLELEGVLLTMYDGRLNLTRQVSEEIKKYFPRKVYSVTIPRNVRLSEAPSYGMPVLYYDKRSVGAEAYNRLAEEFIKAQL